MNVTTRLLFAALLGASSCIDPTPIVVVTANDASTSFAAECRQCVSTGTEMSCAMTVVECEQDQNCASALACVFDRCTGQSFEQFLACVNVCVNDNHIVGDLASDVGIRLYQCIAVGPCRSRCVDDQPAGRLAPSTDAGDGSSPSASPP